MEAIDAAAAKPRRRAPPRGVLVLAAALVVGAGGYAYIHGAKRSAVTDNAYVKTDVTIVAPRVRGHVAEVLVADNQPVKAGQLLVRLDPAEYAARVASAQGDLAIADAAIASAEAALIRLGSEQAVAAAEVREAETGIRAADAEVRRARADWRRYEALVSTGYSPRRDADRVETQAIASAAQADRTRASLSLTRNQASATASRRAELLRRRRPGPRPAPEGRRRPRPRPAGPAARRVRAPVDGVVSDRQANVGDYVQPGSRLLIVGARLDRLYVTANFKETQTARMMPGQRAEVRVDALPGVVLKAHVDSVAPGTGSEFALLPFEPGVGNFTKIVQRVPVRLRLRSRPGRP